ncbi:MAG: efflux RND transporter periplasmic adaptor subunit [Bacteroidia bacterium]|nr:efflux RND transporter periplasmic adaptor subunit [Bacteroidia bacterium]
MKKSLITTGIVLVTALVALYIFNRITSKDDKAGMLTEVSRGKFEIAITGTGELVAENFVEIKGPAFGQGNDVRSTNVRITDLIPEGTEVKTGDYVATLDKTELDNELKDIRERVATREQDLEMIILDTAIQMNNVRDQITNQIHIVEEAELRFRNSKYESPMTLRDAEIDFDQAKRVLDQMNRSYTLRKAQTRVSVMNQKMWLGRMKRRMADYEDVLSSFTITAPADGMIIYYKNRFGMKRKVGQSINVVDRIVATIPDLTTMLSKVFINEVEISKIKPGQRATITVDAFPAKSYTGTIISVANIGEKLPNTDSKVFEVQIKVDGTDLNLRPAMTTNNKIMIATFDDVTYIPIECVHTGSDSIPIVYTESGFRQKVKLGESNEKLVIIEEGLRQGTSIYLEVPEYHDKFKPAK